MATTTASAPPSLPHLVVGKVTPLLPPISPAGLLPQDIYPMHMPGTCLYGWAGEMARKLDCPLGFAYTGILTWYAGSAQLCKRRDQMTNLYTVHCAGVGVGKSRTQKRINQALFPGELRAKHVTKAVFASERGIYERFGYLDALPPLTHTLLQCDEFLEMLQKMNIKNSALSTTLNQLFDEREIESNRKGASDRAYLQLSLLGAIPAADAAGFQDAFGLTTGDGLYDRTIIVPGPASWRFDNEWEPPTVEDDNVLGLRVPAPYRPAKPVAMTHAAWRMLDEWRDAKPGRHGRISLIPVRVAIVASAINHDDEVTVESMRAALALAEWQESVRAVYAPSKSRNDSATATAELLSIMRAAKQAAVDGNSVIVGKERPVVINGCIHLGNLMRKYHLTSKWGGLIGVALKTLVETNEIEEVIEDRVRTGRYLVLEGVST